MVRGWCVRVCLEILFKNILRYNSFSYEQQQRNKNIPFFYVKKAKRNKHFVTREIMDWRKRYFKASIKVVLNVCGLWNLPPDEQKNHHHHRHQHRCRIIKKRIGTILLFDWHRKSSVNQAVNCSCSIVFEYFSNPLSLNAINNSESNFVISFSLIDHTRTNNGLGQYLNSFVQKDEKYEREKKETISIGNEHSIYCLFENWLFSS